MSPSVEKQNAKERKSSIEREHNQTDVGNSKREVQDFDRVCLKKICSVFEFVCYCELKIVSNRRQVLHPLDTNPDVFDVVRKAREQHHWHKNGWCDFDCQRGRLNNCSNKNAEQSCELYIQHRTSPKNKKTFNREVQVGGEVDEKCK